MKLHSYYVDYSLLVAPRPFLCSSHPAFWLPHPQVLGAVGFTSSADSSGFQPVGSAGGWTGGRMEEEYCPRSPLIAAGPATAVAPLCVACALPLSPACRPSGLLVSSRLWGSSQLRGHFFQELHISFVHGFQRVPSPRFPLLKALSLFPARTLIRSLAFLPATRPGIFMISILRREN